MTTTTTRTPRSLTTSEYAQLHRSGYAGTGRPLDPSAPGIWWLEYGPKGTALVFGEVVDDRLASPTGDDWGNSRGEGR